MPMRKGSSQKTIAKNIAEFHTGKTYKHTKAKFGKATADRQAVAAAMRSAGKARTSGRGKTRSRSVSGENEFHRPL